MVHLSQLYVSNGKTIALTIWTFIGRLMSLLFNTLSRFVITFLAISKRLLISWLQSPSAVILEPPKNKVWHCFYFFPIYFPWSDATRCHDLHFLNVDFMANWWRKVEVVTNFLFLCSKITVDGDWSHEIIRWLLLGKKAMTNLDSVLKSRDISLPTKICILMAMVFPVVL